MITMSGKLELFDSAVAQQEAGGAPHGMANELAGNALPLGESRRVLQRGVLRHAPAAPPVRWCDNPARRAAHLRGWAAPMIARFLAGGHLGYLLAVLTMPRLATGAKSSPHWHVTAVALPMGNAMDEVHAGQIDALREAHRLTLEALPVGGGLSSPNVVFGVKRPVGIPCGGYHRRRAAVGRA